MTVVSDHKPELITVAAAARRLGLSLTTLAANPPLEIVRFGGRRARRYFVAAHFEEWLASTKAKSRRRVD
ncbi:MAG: hypothetical protein NW223_24005 [Hyphomicrobiaceae bacterium]|nr:hypothetical protein [Hyphomicrobiaceae bacterium]